ncbi:hypothetical protein CP8484711_1028B, partial [Chlamydia psittaci 84-8471/1]
ILKWQVVHPKRIM